MYNGIPFSAKEKCNHEWVDLENTIFSEVTQTQRNTTCFRSSPCPSSKVYMNIQHGVATETRKV